MKPLTLVLERLKRVKPTEKGYLASCPAHDDRTPSLSINEGDDGRVLLKCHAGCTFEAIVAKLGLRPRDLMPERDDFRNPPQRLSDAKPKATFANPDEAIRAHGRLGGYTGRWDYFDERGQLVGVVVRYDRANGSKTIRPISLHGTTWQMTAMPSPRPLYWLPELKDAPTVLLCEGEKCADAARSLGFIATTSAGGANAARQTNWQSLSGKKVIIWPDNDRAGEGYLTTVMEQLAALAHPPSVLVVRTPELSEGGDIVDWLQVRQGRSPEELKNEVLRLAVQMETPTAVQRQTNALAYRPFPVDVLPSPLAKYVRMCADAIGCDYSFVALPLLGMLAAAIGTTRRLRVKYGWEVRSILWAAVVGESGSAKTPALEAATLAIKDRQNKALQKHAGEMRDYEAEVARWEQEMAGRKRAKNPTSEPPPKPKPPIAERFFVSDTTVEALAPLFQSNPRGLLLIRDELAGWIGGFDRYSGKGKAGADSANFLSMFNGGSVTVDRKTGMPPTIHIPEAALSIVGGIQPGILEAVFAKEHRESGLLARLLLAWPPTQEKCWTDEAIDPLMVKEIARILDRLYELKVHQLPDGSRQPIILELSPEAKELWKQHYGDHNREQVELTGDLAAAWSKLEEYPARLALVFHCVRVAANDPTVKNAAIVDAESMQAGITLVGWFKNESRRVYESLNETETERNQRKLIEWIARRGGVVAPRQVQSGCRWLRAPGDAEKALELLVQQGFGSWETGSVPPSGGHSQRMFRLHNARQRQHSIGADEEDEPSADADSTRTPANLITDTQERNASADADTADEALPELTNGQLFPELVGLPD